MQKTRAYFMAEWLPNAFVSPVHSQDCVRLLLIFDSFLYNELNTRKPDRVFEIPGPGFLGPNTRDFGYRVTRTCNPYLPDFCLIIITTL